MIKYFTLFILFAESLFSQSLIYKAEYIATEDRDYRYMHMLKDTTDNKIYIITEELDSDIYRYYLKIMNASFQEIITLPIAQTMYNRINLSFIENNCLYYADKVIKNINLYDFKIDSVNMDREKIVKHMANLEGKRTITIKSEDTLFFIELLTGKELFHIKFDSWEKNCFIISIDDSYIYYSSQSDVVTKYDFKNNEILWKFSIDEKPIISQGVHVARESTWILDITPYSKNEVKYIGIYTGFGDYYVIDEQTGKLIRKNIQFEARDGEMENNSMIFTKAYYFNDHQNDRMLIYAASEDHNIYCLEENSFKSIWKTDIGNMVQSSLVFFDINNDSYPEVFGITDYVHMLFVVDGKTGGKIIFEQIEMNSKDLRESKIYLADLYGRGILNIIVGVNFKKIIVYELSGVQVPKNYFYNSDSIISNFIN